MGIALSSKKFQFYRGKNSFVSKKLYWLAGSNLAVGDLVGFE